MKDFFFGTIYDDSNEHSTSFLSFLQKISGISKKQFGQQLNRFLLTVNNKIIISESTSHPYFNKFTDALLSDDVHSIVIEKRTDINKNVEATLACNIYFLNGVVCVRPHWCGYKKSRSDEIISTLLVPLILNGFRDKVSLDFDSIIEKLPLDNAAALNSIFGLAAYPDQQAMQQYIKSLNIASEIYSKNLDLATSYKEYNNAIWANLSNP